MIINPYMVTPSGAGSPLRSTSGLISLFDAQTISGADGDRLRTWADYTGNNSIPLLGATATERPTLKLNIVDGSKSVVRFDGTQFLPNYAATGIPVGGAPFTEYLVFSAATNQHKSIVSFGSTGGTGSRGGFFLTSADKVLYEGAANDSVGSFTCPVDGTPMLISAVYPGGALSNYQQWHNGVAETMTGSGSTAAPSYIPSEIKLGGMAANGSFNFVGDIAIYAIFAGAHTTDQRESIESELIADYGI